MDSMHRATRWRCTVARSVGIGMTLVTLCRAAPAGAAIDSLHREIARGAATIASVTAKRRPHPTIYRSIRDALEKNMQEHHDSEGFRLGAHLIAAFWLERLPQDVPWREVPLARHRDIVRWLMEDTKLGSDDVAETAAAAAHLTEAQAAELSDALRRWMRQADRSRRAAP